MFIATLENGWFNWYLRGTTWSGFPDRADKFDTKEMCEEAVQKAAKFMKKSTVKKVVIEEVK